MLFARAYDRLMTPVEDAGLAAMRMRLLATASGDVLEIGAGTGSNVHHYGPEVASLTLTEPDRSMRRRLEPAVAGTQHPTAVVDAPAEHLPFEDDSFDSVVSTLVLCGVGDQGQATDEIRRVLKPDGRLLLIEHVRADDPETARRQDRINWLQKFFAGCDCNRTTGQTLRDHGFEMREVVADAMPKAPDHVRAIIVGAATIKSATA
jgi:ubiquinone/menaquinone biosynthesis C-methylase UbiE